MVYVSLQKCANGYACGQHDLYNTHILSDWPTAWTSQCLANEDVLASSMSSCSFLTIPRETRRTIQTILLVPPFKWCWKTYTPQLGHSDAIKIKRKQGGGRRGTWEDEAGSLGQRWRGRTNIGFSEDTRRERGPRKKRGKENKWEQKWKKKKKDWEQKGIKSSQSQRQDSNYSQSLILSSYMIYIRMWLVISKQG